MKKANKVKKLHKIKDSLKGLFALLFFLGIGVVSLQMIYHIKTTSQAIMALIGLVSFIALATAVPAVLEES